MFEEYENCDKDFVYGYSNEEFNQMVDRLENGQFSSDLQKYLNNSTINFHKILRNLFKEYIYKHGHFDLECDDLAYLVLDIQFYLLEWNKSIKSKDDFVKHCLSMIANPNDEISLGGNATQHIEDWFDDRLDSGFIKRKLFRGFKYTPAFERTLFKQINKYGH